MTLAATDPRCQMGAVIRCVSGRVYEVLRLERRRYRNYGRLGGWLGDGLFAALGARSAANTCSTCGKTGRGKEERGGAQRGRIGWLSEATVMDSVLVPLPECPDVLVH